MPEKKEKEETATEPEPKKDEKTIIVRHEFVVPKKGKKEKTPKTPETPAKTPETPETPPKTPPVTPPATPPKTPVTPEDKVTTLEGEKKALEAKITELEGNAEKTKGIETELEQAKKDLKERTDVLALIALKEFEGEKKTLIDTVRKDWETKGLEKDEIDKRIKYMDETIDDTDKLKQVLELTKIFQPPTNAGGGEEVESGDGKPTATPAGKATLPVVPKQYTGMKGTVDELYNILADPSKTPAEKDEADRRINEMFMEFIKGVRVSQQRGAFPTFTRTECPQCHELIEGKATSCDHCGWKLIVPRMIKTR